MKQSEKDLYKEAIDRYFNSSDKETALSCKAIFCEVAQQYVKDINDVFDYYRVPLRYPSLAYRDMYSLDVVSVEREHIVFSFSEKNNRKEFSIKNNVLLNFDKETYQNEIKEQCERIRENNFEKNKLIQKIIKDSRSIILNIENSVDKVE